MYIVYSHFSFVEQHACLFPVTFVANTTCTVPLEFVGSFYSFQVPSLWFSLTLDAKFNCHCH